MSFYNLLNIRLPELPYQLDFYWFASKITDKNFEISQKNMKMSQKKAKIKEKYRLFAAFVKKKLKSSVIIIEV